MNVTPGPRGRTMILRSLAGAASSMAGRVRARPARLTPARNRSLSPARVVHVTSKRVVPTLAKASSIARASLYPVLALSSAIAPPVSLRANHVASMVATAPKQEASDDQDRPLLLRVAARGSHRRTVDRVHVSLHGVPTAHRLGS